MAKGEVRKKNKALLAALKAKPAEDTAAPMHGEKSPEEQCALALAKAVKDDDAGEILACLKSLFGHFESDAGEGDDEGS